MEHETDDGCSKCSECEEHFAPIVLADVASRENFRKEKRSFLTFSLDEIFNCLLGKVYFSASIRFGNIEIHCPRIPARRWVRGRLPGFLSAQATERWAQPQPAEGLGGENL